MKYNSLNKKHNYKLSVEDAATIMEITPQSLRTALEAANLRFSEISKYNSTLVCNKSDNFAYSYISNLPKEIYELLEELYIDHVAEEKVFLSRGLSLNHGRQLVQKYLKDIFRLM
jgi:hypothetical protein